MARLVGLLTIASNSIAMGQSAAPATQLGLPPQVRVEPPAAIVELGRRLFFDQVLSADGTISCATCHIPEKAYSDGRRVAQGITAVEGTRNTPTLLNVAFQTSFFWDGRRESLEAQAADPFFSAREHGFASPADLLQAIASRGAYADAFAAAFGADTISLSRVMVAIASFERTLLAGGSDFDRYYYGKDDRALSPAAQRGLRLFQGRAQCVACHTINDSGAIFSDGKFHGAGVGVRKIEANLAAIATRAATASDGQLALLLVSDPEIAALGRFVVSKKPGDIGQYRTPSLRNVAVTAPYMHDGSVATLDEAIDRELYYRSARAGRPIVLTQEEKSDLKAFLLALTSPSWPLNLEPPGHMRGDR
jgi:cytochrome c peroxidase